MNAAVSKSALIFRVGERTCALNLRHVVEVMRPLPVAEMANTPGFVRGLSIIRGVPTPVVLLASLYAGAGGRPTRFVIVRVGERRVALAVDSVLGVIDLDPATLHALPPLFQNGAADTLEAVGALDAQFLFVLNSGSILPEEAWQEPVLPQP